MLVAGVVILYHPDDAVLQNIHSYLPYVEKLYLVDNTEEKQSDIVTQLQNEAKINVHYDGRNEGIAKRLNEAANWAIANGFNWLLTMDQDSSFAEKGIEDYLLCVSNYDDKEEVAMFGVEHELKNELLQSCSPIERNKVITSGSLLNLVLFTKIGNFNERLFIDEVDFEYCYRARLLGYMVIKFNNIFLLHSLGKISYHKSLKNLKTSNRALHSPFRMYFMVRNFFYVNHHFKKHFPEDIKESRNGLLNRIKNNLLYNRDRSHVFLNIYKGFFHYLTKKF